MEGATLGNGLGGWMGDGELIIESRRDFQQLTKLSYRKWRRTERLREFDEAHEEKISRKLT